MKQSSSAEIIHISTPHDIQEVYGKEAFKAYIVKETKTGLEIQSKFIVADNIPATNTPYKMSKVWDTIIEKIITNKKINLGQMLRNYANTKSKLEDRKAIFHILFDIAMTDVEENIAMTEEVAMLGIAMMLKDDLVDSNPMSIVHMMHDRVISALASSSETEQQTKTA